MKFGVKARIWDHFPKPNFVKKKSHKGVYPFWANLYQKIPMLAIWGAVGPYFKATTLKFGRSVRTWDSPQAKFGENRLRGYIPFWQNYTKN